MGPDGSAVPGHAFRCDETFEIGAFDPVGGDDTPGAANDCTPPSPCGDGSGPVPIHTLQGDGAATPCPGQEVTTSGIVTATFTANDAISGFFMQAPDAFADGNVLTSEGIFVFCGANCGGAAVVGNAVSVDGIVEEQFGTTQVDTAGTGGSVSVISSGNPLPTPASVTLPATAGTDDSATFEHVEGMLVQIPTTLAVSEYFELARFGQVVLTAEERPFTVHARQRAGCRRLRRVPRRPRHEGDRARRRQQRPERRDQRRFRRAIPVPRAGAVAHEPVPRRRHDHESLGCDALRLRAVAHPSVGGVRLHVHAGEHHARGAFRRRERARQRVQRLELLHDDRHHGEHQLGSVRSVGHARLPRRRQRGRVGPAAHEDGRGDHGDRSGHRGPDGNPERRRVGRRRRRVSQRGRRRRHVFVRRHRLHRHRRDQGRPHLPAGGRSARRRATPSSTRRSTPASSTH